MISASFLVPDLRQLWLWQSTPLLPPAHHHASNHHQDQSFVCSFFFVEPSFFLSFGITICLHSIAFITDLVLLSMVSSFSSPAGSFGCPPLLSLPACLGPAIFFFSSSLPLSLHYHYHYYQYRIGPLKKGHKPSTET